MLRLHVRFLLRLHWFKLCSRRSGDTAHEGGGCQQSIGSTVSDAIARSWLWLTATRSSPLDCFRTLLQVMYATLSGCTGSALSGIPKVPRSRLSQCSKSCELQPSPHCSVQYMWLRGNCPVYQSIWSTVSDAIVRNWLWLTATRSSPLGYFSKLLQVVDNWTDIL